MSFNISVPEELIQDVSDQNVIVSGHSQLVDVSCQHLDVSVGLKVDGHSQLVDISCQHLDVSGGLKVDGHSQLLDVSCQHLDVSGGLQVDGHSQLVDVSCQHLDVTGDLDVTGNTTIGGTLDVTGEIYGTFNRILTTNLYATGPYIISRANGYGEGIIFQNDALPGYSQHTKTMMMMYPVNNYIETLIPLKMTGGTTTSDDRIKKNEKKIINSLNSILKLEPLIYEKYNNISCSGEYFIESGLIVQHIYYNIPELRHLLVNDNYDVCGNKIIPIEITKEEYNNIKNDDYEG
jgi:hypothetical protein